VPFSALARRCYPHVTGKLKLWQRWVIYKALARYGTPVRHGWWQPNDELLKRIRGDV
jgi:hypothetical protein